MNDKQKDDDHGNNSTSPSSEAIAERIDRKILTDTEDEGKPLPATKTQLDSPLLAQPSTFSPPAKTAASSPESLAAVEGPSEPSLGASACRVEELLVELTSSSTTTVQSSGVLKPDVVEEHNPADPVATRAVDEPKTYEPVETPVPLPSNDLRTIRRGNRRTALLEYERTFLSYQRDLREGGTRVLNEAMLVLDIIDSKTQSLLSYISVSLAALVFLISTIPGNSRLSFTIVGQEVVTTSLLVLILALLLASVLCLSCLNIVGGHTIRSIWSDEQNTQQEYEALIVRVTSARRNRYLIAHRVSIVTAVLTFILFSVLLISTLAAARSILDSLPYE
jgi:hypothetical protein